jgi:hypothetical protein
MNCFEKQAFLLVEDNENDVLLMKEAFCKAEIPNPLQIVDGGDKAIAYLTVPRPIRIGWPIRYLRNTADFAAGKDGRSSRPRWQPTLKRLVIIILTL